MTDVKSKTGKSFLGNFLKFLGRLLTGELQADLEKARDEQQKSLEQLKKTHQELTELNQRLDAKKPSQPDNENPV